MNLYQTSIRSVIILLTLLFSNQDCYNQEVLVRTLKVSTGNDKYDKYAPIYESRAKLLIWTQRNVGQSGDTLDKLWFSDKESTTTQQFDILGIPYSLSSIGTCNISLDGNIIVFSGTRIAQDTTWVIMIGKKVENKYIYSMTIDSGKSWMGHPCLSLGDSMIIFSAIKNSANKSDLYFSIKNGNEYWTVPELVSDNINTDYEELSPFLTSKKNNLLLYFSSDRKGGKGGLDIYYSLFDVVAKTWANPISLPSVNTEFDEAFPSVPHDTSADSILYFASNRSNDNNWEIFTASPNPVPPIYIIVEGTVFNASFENQVSPIKNSNIIFRNFNSSKRLSVLSTDDYGHYIAKMPLDTKLYVEAYASAKASKDTLVYYSSETLKNMKSVKLDFFLKDTFSLVTDTVFFEYAKADLKINSKVELILQRISDYLKMNPGNKIKIVGHTDKIGGYDYNIGLSERRAKAVVDTLINLGIDTKSFQFEGKAYLQPLPGLDNCIDNECAPNRRVEIFYLYRKE